VSATILGVVPNQAGKGADRDYRYPYRYAHSRRKDRDLSDAVTAEGLQYPSSRRAALPAPPPVPEPVRDTAAAPPADVYRAPRQRPMNGQPHADEPIAAEPYPPPRRPAHGYPDH
jgi:hypothetical protein